MTKKARIQKGSLRTIGIWMVVVVGMLLGLSWYGYSRMREEPQPINPEVASSEAVQPEEATIIDERVKVLYERTNTEREKIGLKQLVYAYILVTSAQQKCLDMQEKRYIAHDAPGGKKFDEFISNQYHAKGENIAFGFVNMNAVADAWVKSKAHYDNLVSPAYREVGFGLCDGPMGPLVIQHFGG